jgi:hypothetical protein
MSESYDQAADLRKRHVILIKNTCLTLGHILSGISQSEAQTWRDPSDAPIRWTVLEVLGHLADFDNFFYLRAQMMLEQDYPSLPAYDHDALAIEHAYNQQEKDRVYARLQDSRARFREFFKGLSEAQWQRSGIHLERGHFTMLDALVQVGTHDVTHLEQITRIIRERKA